MKTLVASLLMLIIATAFQSSSVAQKQPAKPEFNDAPITDVLMWAQQSIGCGFMYDAKDLIDPDTQKVYEITASHIEPKTKAERTLLLFELLQTCGIVAFEIGGLPGPTYELVHGKNAATNAPVITSIDQLGDYYYASLTIRLHRASAIEAAERVKKVLTPGASDISAIGDTHTIIVTDFADRLRQAYEITLALDIPTIRADDLIIANFAPVNTVATKLAAVVERLRGKGQLWKLTVNENANVLLISGTRNEVEGLVNRMKQVDAFPQKPEFQETTQSIKLIFITASDAARTLREMFATQISAGSIQIGAMESGRKVIFRGSTYDLERVKENLKVIDVRPENRVKDE